MKPYLADMHIHSALSPCGSMEMKAFDIISMAIRKGLNIIALTDHNCTKQVSVLMEMAQKANILVIPGLEVNTSEEIHCLVYFETIAQLTEFQLFIDIHLPAIKNIPELYGHQVWADENGDIIGEVDELLVVALTASFAEVANMVKSMGGLVVPAHIDRPINSILPFIESLPQSVLIDAIEVGKVSSFNKILAAHPILSKWNVMSNSDAHFLNDIGHSTTLFYLKELSFKEIKLAMHKKDGRWMAC